jgi:hypothetical protein
MPGYGYNVYKMYKVPAGSQGSYRVVCYAMYNSQTTEPASIVLNRCTGGKFDGDIDGDCYVNFEDFDRLGLQWLEQGCGMGVFCGRADVDSDGSIDIDDLGRLANQWLWCNEPDDPLCGG